MRRTSRNTKEVQEVLDLIFDDRPREALELAENYCLDIAPKIREKLDHVFNPKRYKDKYITNPISLYPPELVLFNADRMYERYAWILEEITKTKSKTFLDVGCCEGALVFTTRLKNKIEAYGVEASIDAVVHANAIAKQMGMGGIFSQSLAEDFTPKRKYDLVSCNEMIEHVADPVALIKKLVNLSQKWVIITTPDGCFDPEATKNVWNTEGAMFDHVNYFNRDILSDLLSNYDHEFHDSTDGLIHVKFKV